MNQPLVVACAVWGDWPSTRTGRGEQHKIRSGTVELQQEYIRRLYNGVQRNLSVPHRFICFADDTEKVPKGIEAKLLQTSYWGRALPKAFVYGAPYTGCDLPEGTRILMFDLDNVIVGSLDSLVDHGGQLVARERGYKLPAYVPDGDIIFAETGSEKSKECARLFLQETENRGATTDSGDEREICRRAGAACWGQIRPGQVLGYKRHCKAGLPSNARVVSFHGRPLPENAPDEWIKEHWI